jgi:hypothetical protein
LLIATIGLFTSCGRIQNSVQNALDEYYSVHRIEEGIEEKLVESLDNQDIDAFRALFAYSATIQETFLEDTQTIMDFYGGEVYAFNVHRPAEYSVKRGDNRRTYTDPLIDVDRASDKYVIHVRYESMTTVRAEELGIHSIEILLNGNSHAKSFGLDGYETLEDDVFD